jgi:hypothetical protein
MPLVRRRFRTSAVRASFLTGVFVVVCAVIPLTAQPLSDETVAELVHAGLLYYFDPSSIFNISVTNARMSGDTLLIDDLTVSGKPAFLRGTRGEFFLRASNLHLHASALYSQQITIRQVGKATLVARTTASALAGALARVAPSVINPSVKLHAGEFQLAAGVRQEGKLYPTHARGKLMVERGQRVWVTVSEMRVSGGDVPENTVRKELARINPILDLSQWPLDLRIQRLNLHNDVIELLATK